jgi:hypothetical protein
MGTEAVTSPWAPGASPNMSHSLTLTTSWDHLPSRRRASDLPASPMDAV